MRSPGLVIISLTPIRWVLRGGGLLVFERVRTAIHQLSSEYLVPELGCNAKALLEVCEVVLEMVFLEFLVVCWETVVRVSIRGGFVRGLAGKLTIYGVGNSG